MAQQQMPARDRATEEKTQRRRRMDGTLDQSLDMKLFIPPAIRAEYEKSHRLRWFNDVGSRISSATERDDWDKVPGVDSRHVGTNEHGKPIHAILLMKPLQFDEQDQGVKEERRRELERAALEGASSDPEGRDAAEPDKRFAVAGNRLTSSTYAP